MPEFRRRSSLLACLVLLLLLAGCGAYFNTYYNAQEAYDEGVRTKEESGERSARSSFDKCLRVSSKLLQFYPESRWVDDTILLIGQCYVHLGQNHRALRKFDELEARFPESDLNIEASIWRARSLLALERMDAAFAELSRLSGKKLERRLRVERSKVLAELFQSEQDLDRLVETQEELLGIVRKRADKAHINLEIARSYEEIGLWDKALKHYGNTRRYRPRHDLLLESWLGSLDNMIRLEMLDKASHRLRKLQKDERFFDERHTLLLRKAWVADADGDVETAISIWRELLEEHKSTESSSAAAYGLGQVFFVAQEEPDSAEVYFRKSKQEKGNSIWADSSQRALDLLSQLRDTRDRISELDLAIHVRQNRLDPDSSRVLAAKDRLERLRPLLLDSLDAMEQLADSMEQAQVDTTELKIDRVKEPRSKVGDGRRRRLFDFSRKDREEARQDSLNEARLLDSLNQVKEDARLASLDSLWLMDVLDTLSVTVIDSSLYLGELDSLRKASVEERFVMAELYAIKLERPQRADSQYQDLLRDPAASEDQSSRLHYAYGVLRIQQFEDSSGYSWLERLIENYPLSPAANPARRLLGLPPAVTAEDSASVLLAAAEQSWLNGAAIDSVLKAYNNCALVYPETRAAYTAWIAQGVLALEDLENPVLAGQHFREALRRFPEGEANEELRQRLGLASLEELESEEEEELPGQQVELASEQLDDEGRFVDPNSDLSIDKRLEALRARFEEIGRIVVNRILE